MSKVRAEYGNTNSSQLSTSEMPTTTSLKHIILRRAGMWTGTLVNDLEVANAQLYQDTNPANPSHYYISIGQRYLFNVTNGESIDLKSIDNLAVIWP